MSSDNFDDIVTSDSAVWVVNFYDSAAPETEKWASTWTSLKSEIQEVKFASVDVESKKGTWKNTPPAKATQATSTRSQPVHVRRHDGGARPPDEFDTHQGQVRYEAVM